MGKLKTLVSALALPCLLLAGCGNQNSTQSSTQSSITAIAISPTTATLAKGLTLQLTATGTFSGGPQNVTSSASWSSSNPSVLTVSASGLVTAVTQGTATIGVFDGSVNQTLSMTITNPIVSSIAVTGPSSSVAVGLTLQLTATATYTDGTIAKLTTATWQSSNSAIASVAAGGLVTGKQAGTATITATDSVTGVSGKFQLTVIPPVLRSIAVTGASPSIYVGQTVQLTATGTFSDGSTSNLTATATWNSPSPTVASVSGGLVTGVGAGSAVITASSGGVSGSFTVTVSAAGSVILSPSLPQLPLGSTLQVSASNNTGNVTGQVTWTTSDPTTFTVVSGGPLSGLITARKVGTATLTATLGGNQTPVMVTVTAAPTSRLAITANSGDSTLSVYTVNNASGSLTPYTYSVLPSTMVDPVNLLVGPTGQFAYVAVKGGVGVLAITSTSGTSSPLGTLMPLAGGFYATTNAPTGMSFNPAGTYLYVTDGDQIFAFAVNSTSGALTPVSGSPFTNVGASNVVAVEPLGRFLYSSIGSTGKIAEFSIQSSGSLQALVQPYIASGSQPEGIAFDASGLYLYVANSGDGTIGSYAISPSAGTLTLVNAATVGTQPVALAASPAGLVYFIDATADTVGSVSVNVASGELTANTSLQPTIAAGAGILFNPGLNYLYAIEPAATSQAETYSLDPSGNPLWATSTATRAQGAALAFVPGNQTVYGPEFLYSLVSGQGNVMYDIDTTNGTLSNQTNVDGGR